MTDAPSEVLRALEIEVRLACRLDHFAAAAERHGEANDAETYHAMHRERRKLIEAIAALAPPAPQAATAGCTMGVGCDEAGVCYARAHGKPEMCPQAATPSSAQVGLVLTPDTDTGALRDADRNVLCYPGTPLAWHVKPEDFPPEQPAPLSDDDKAETFRKGWEAGHAAAPLSDDARAVEEGCPICNGDCAGAAVQPLNCPLATRPTAAPSAPLEAGKGGEDWTRDAIQWGGALNDAAWTFIEHCPEKSALLFNNTKVPLRLAILKYAEIVVRTAAEPESKG
ncbi:hypothetical protein [Lysobacter sp. HA35]